MTSGEQRHAHLHLEPKLERNAQALDTDQERAESE